MSITTIKQHIGDYAKDIRLNLSSVMTEEGSPDLTQRQIDFIGLATAFALDKPDLIKELHAETLTSKEVDAARSAASIMSMNNIYYRFVHLVSDQSYASLPAKLRMNVMANPGVSSQDFELASLAISAVNGCGMCIDSHVKALEKEGVSKIAIQSAVRIAAVINAASVSLM